MSHPEHRATIVRLVRAACAIVVAFAASSASAQVPEPSANAPKANWAAWDKWSTASMRGTTFSQSVNPKWFGESDTLFYSWRDTKGTTWYMVNAFTKAKKPLFDHVKLAAQLSVLNKKPIEPRMLHDAFNSVNVTKDHKSLRFQVDSMRYNWAIATEMLTQLGRYRGPNSADSALTKDEEGTDFGVGGGGDGGRGGGRGGRGVTPVAPGGGGTPPDWRNWAPDSTAFVFARNNNLYVWEKTGGDTIQITTEGVQNYGFGGGGGRGGGQQDSTENDNQQQQQGGRGAQAANRNTRPQVTWSGDSKAFFTSRTDNRFVKQLCLVNVLTEPRPSPANCYNYAMPAEDSIPRPEIWTYSRGEKVAKKSPVLKWKDQQYGVQSFVGKDGTKLRLTRRDRLQRNIEYIELDIPSGNVKVLASDTKGEAGSLESNQIRYVKFAGGGGGGGRGGGGGGAAPGGPANQTSVVPGSDFIFWSEKSGWGHYYLYGFDGTLKRQLTSGDWRADQIVEIDTVRNQIYVRGQGREAGENLYYQHLYRVDMATSAITLLDPGDAHHTSQLSTNRKWVVDNAARMDSIPKVTLRDATGRLVMDLEKMDLSRLYAQGWKHVEPFMTLAADGVTPIFGNIWRPFDLDTTKKYPVIAHVYPGPQTESVNNGFSTGGSQMQLAQLGFIVVQIGNRGGTPARSAAYQDFSYFNMRDYALADKKAGIEQLAAKYKYMDIDRVGIYGHSGGGFLTAAALLLPPFNDFFKVGASESGNHDNNMYNSNWSEQYHGLKWVAAADTARLTAEARAKGRTGGEFSAGQAITAAMNAVNGGSGGRGGRGGGGGGGGNGGRGGQGRAGQAGAGGQAAATGADGAPATRADSAFWIYVPTNIDIAANLKGKLLLSTGDMDNNVHPGNTIRLVNALLQNNKRFDLMIYPGQPHSFGPFSGYAFQLQAEYFAEFLLGDNTPRRSADFNAHK